MSVLQSIGEGFRSLGRKSVTQPGYGGAYGGSDWAFGRSLPGTAFDYKEEAGIVWQNSVVYACLQFEATQLNEAALTQQKKVGGKWSEKEDSELVKLIENPNPYYDGDVLWASTILSRECAGNAYWIKDRNSFGRPAALWYTPHWMMRPIWDAEGRNFISYYEYSVNGKKVKLATTEVVHFRSQFLNPANLRYGLTPMDAILREIVTDNEAATFMAALLRNMGFPGVIVSPKENMEDALTPEQRADIKRRFDSQFTGDGRGGTLVNSVPIQIDTPTFSPDEMALEKLRGISEERICAAFGLPTVVVGMGSGLSKSTAKASYGESLRQAYVSKIQPTGKQLVRQATKQLMPDFEAVPERNRLMWDWSDVAAVQRDALTDAKAKQIECGGAYRTVNEIREESGLPPIEGGDELRQGPGAEDKPDGKDEDENNDD